MQLHIAYNHAVSGGLSSTGSGGTIAGRGIAVTASASASKFCGNCGAGFPAVQAKFCGECGCKRS